MNLELCMIENMEEVCYLEQKFVEQCYHSHSLVLALSER